MLDEVDFEAMNNFSEYIPSPERLEDTLQQHFSFANSSLEFKSGSPKYVQPLHKEDASLSFERISTDLDASKAKCRNSRLKIKGGNLRSESSFLQTKLREEITTAAKLSSTSSESEYSQKSKCSRTASKPRQMLSLRTDVMNKNLFRAIRRE